MVGEADGRGFVSPGSIFSSERFALDTQKLSNQEVWGLLNPSDLRGRTETRLEADWLRRSEIEKQLWDHENNYLVLRVTS